MKIVYILEIHKWVKCKGPKGEKMDVDRYESFVFDSKERLDLFFNQMESMNERFDSGLFFTISESIYMEGK